MKVYICPKSDDQIYHTRICNALSTHQSTRVVLKSHVEGHKRLCKVCENGVSGPTEQDQSYIKALKNTDPEDIDAFK